VAIDCDGTGDFLSVAAAVVTADPCSLAAWFNPDNITAQLPIIGVHDGTTGNRFFIFSNGTQAGDPVSAASNATAADVAHTSTSVVAGAWQHACGVFSSSTRAAFLNGGGKVTNANAVVPSGITTTEIARSGSGGVMSGLIAEAAIWDAALTDAEVAILAKGFSPLLVRPQSLFFYAPIIKNANVIDLIGGLTLTVNGNPTEAAHPRVFMPKRRQPFHAEAAAGGGFQPAWAARNNVVLGAGFG
jgi:hypothetical protein